MQSFFDTKIQKGKYKFMTNLTKYEMENVDNYNAREQTDTVYTGDKAVNFYVETVAYLYGVGSIGKAFYM